MVCSDNPACSGLTLLQHMKETTVSMKRFMWYYSQQEALTLQASPLCCALHEVVCARLCSSRGCRIAQLGVAIAYFLVTSGSTCREHLLDVSSNYTTYIAIIRRQTKSSHEMIACVTACNVQIRTAGPQAAAAAAAGCASAATPPPAAAAAGTAAAAGAAAKTAAARRWAAAAAAAGAPSTGARCPPGA